MNAKEWNIAYPSRLPYETVFRSARRWKKIVSVYNQNLSIFHIFHRVFTILTTKALSMIVGRDVTIQLSSPNTFRAQLFVLKGADVVSVVNVRTLRTSSDLSVPVIGDSKHCIAPNSSESASASLSIPNGRCSELCVRNLPNTVRMALSVINTHPPPSHNGVWQPGCLEGVVA